MSELFFREDVLHVLHGIVKLAGNQKKAAAKLGVSTQYLSNVLSGIRPPRGKLLAALGFAETERYCKSAVWPVKKATVKG